MKDFRTKKALGQNFLIDPNIQEKIVACLDKFTYDEIIEIGPGSGALTNILRLKEKKLTVIEFDRELAAHWRSCESDNFKVIESDILKLEFNSHFSPDKKYVVIGNIPYNITTPIIFKLFDHLNIISGIIIMIQKEVAERMCSAKDSKEFGVLTLMCQLVTKMSYEFSVPRHVFRPAPNVDSAVISLSIGGLGSTLTIAELERLKKLIRATFQHRRKMLRVSLKAFCDLSNYNGKTDLTKRPENLSLEEFIELAKELP